MKKRTKIVATVSDLRCDVEFLTGLYNRGVNVVRLNTAHQTPDATIKVISNIRKVSDKIAILVDTKGPEIRTGPVQKEDIQVKRGDEFLMRYDGEGVANTREVVQVNYAGFASDVPVGTSILVDDGYLELMVLSSSDEGLRVRVENDGEIKKKKSVNVPGVAIQLPSITDKDRAFIEMSIDQGVDFIAHSFVRSQADVLAVQEILDAKGASDIKIIAKIENREGVDNLEEILDSAYGVMVARGDLGIEIPGEEVPLVQKDMIDTCIRRSKPVITATQMLESMIKNPRATRAETSDVANAILDGTDAIMLSGETAYGDYPYEAVETMARIAEHVETKMVSYPDRHVKNTFEDIQAYVAIAAAKSVSELNVEAIVIPTRTGGTVRQVSAHRPAAPIYAACYEPNALRQLALSYGVSAYTITNDKRLEVAKDSLEALKNDKLQGDDLVAFIMTTPGSPDGETNQLEINTVDAIIETRSA